MNETLVFFKILNTFKKSIETEAIFTKTEMNCGGNVNFLQNTRCF